MPDYGSSGDCRVFLGSPTETEVAGSLITTCLSRATNTVNSYLEHTYPEQVPFTAAADVPAKINDITTDIAIYYAKRAKYPGPGPLTESVKTDYYDPAIATLEAIRDEKIKLPELTSKITGGITANQIDYKPTFGIGDELSQTIDSDHLQDEQDARK